MLQIVRRDRDESTVTLKLEGRLIGEWVAVLKAACLALLPERGRVELNCAGVSLADTPAGAMLRELAARGVSIVNAAPAITALLRANGPMLRDQPVEITN